VSRVETKEPRFSLQNLHFKGEANIASFVQSLHLRYDTSIARVQLHHGQVNRRRPLQGTPELERNSWPTRIVKEGERVKERHVTVGVLCILLCRNNVGVVDALDRHCVAAELLEIICRYREDRRRSTTTLELLPASAASTTNSHHLYRVWEG